MTFSKRYKSAPIIEAVIEIRVQPNQSLDQTALSELADSLKSEFPKQTPMHLVHMGIAHQQAGAALSQTFSQANVGFRLAKSDDSRILQVRQDGLAYSHMAPYTDWPTFRAEAEPLWAKYRTICPQSKLVRCALRYINRIDIPGKTIEVFDYFDLYAHIPNRLPSQDVIGGALSVQMPQPDLECVANISQVMSEPVKPDHISFILDVDVFRLGIEAWHDADGWGYLDKLRDRKNQIFEACITDRTRELIDR